MKRQKYLGLAAFVAAGLILGACGGGGGEQDSDAGGSAQQRAEALLRSWAARW
jgi:hypothetical protein